MEMNAEDFVRVLKTLEAQVLEISGCITLAQEDEEMRRLAQKHAVGVVHGIRNIHQSLEAHPHGQ